MLGDDGVKYLCEALKRNSSLLKLDISGSCRIETMQLLNIFNQNEQVMS